MAETVEIRLETAEDLSAIFDVNQAAFGRENEARLVDSLREAGALTISLVAALSSGEIIGHIAFSPVTLTNESGQTMQGLGLGPVAVVPEYQNHKIGSSLITAGLELAFKFNVPFVILLGEPAYYQRFGFVPAVNYGIRWEHPAPEEAFLIQIHPENPPLIPGIIRYHSVFNQV